MAGPNNLPNIEDGNRRRLIVDWNASVTRLNVFFVNTSTPELTYTSDIVSNVFSGDSLVFWGFTGSTEALEIYKNLKLSLIWKHLK